MDTYKSYDWVHCKSNYHILHTLILKVIVYYIVDAIMVFCILIL